MSFFANRPYLGANHFFFTASFSYGVLSLALLYFTVKHGGSFMYLAVVACMLECHGYNTIGRDNDDPTYIYFPAAKYLLTLVNYIVIGRLLRASGKNTIFCVWTQFVSFLLQFSHCVLTIIIHPIIVFMIAISYGFYYQDSAINWILALLIKNIPFASILYTVAFSKKFEMWKIPQLRKTFFCLFSSTGLIFLSDIYHIFASLSYYGSYVTTSEVPFIIFEMLTMLICFILFTVFHYGKVTPIEFLRGYGRNAPLLGITGEEYRRLPLTET